MKFRADIQGLRAIAVIAVIAHHAFPQVITGGFIGVDLFFVISGYLITQILIGDSSKKLRDYLADFYARRARRILPAALLVIIVSTFVTYLILGPVTGSDTARDGLWSSFFLANWHFNQLAIDYFNSALPLPILQHYWSLAIEEQFYLLWPIILFALIKFRVPPLFGIGSITVASLAYCVANNGSSASYFSTLTRVWELGAGSILALSNFHFPKRLWSNLSLLLFIALVFIYDQNTPFPGLPALWVVLIGVSLLMTSHTNGMLKNRALVYVGDLSFVLYLWHWPILQIARLDGWTSTTRIWIALGAIIALSIATHHAFENPIRYSQISSRLALALGVAGLTLSTALLQGMRNLL